MDRAVVRLTVRDRQTRQPELGQFNGLDLHAQSCFERTGGDFFDAVRVGSRVAFLLSDVAGRRPELDPIVATLHETFRASAAQLFSDSDANLMEGTEMLVHAINQALIGVANGVRFAPTMVGCYDGQLGVLAYVNAGGQTALLHDSEGTRALPNVSMPLGLFAHLTYDASMQACEPGAVLLVVTKGVTERMGGKNPLAPDKLIEVLKSSRDESASGVCVAALKVAQELGKRRLWLPFRGRVLSQDLTALALVRRSQQ